jgi:hypothetical protein
MKNRHNACFFSVRHIIGVNKNKSNRPRRKLKGGYYEERKALHLNTQLTKTGNNYAMSHHRSIASALRKARDFCLPYKLYTPEGVLLRKGWLAEY